MPAAASSLTASATTNGATPVITAACRPMAVFCAPTRANRPSQVVPHGVDHQQAGGHRHHGRQVAAVEAALGEVADEERGERVRHQVAAGRPEQAQRAGRQRHRRGEHRQAGDTGGQVEQLAARTQPGAEHQSAEQHHHRLEGERHLRERQRHADLRRRGGQRRHEQHRRHPDGTAVDAVRATRERSTSARRTSVSEVVAACIGGIVRRRAARCLSVPRTSRY